MSYTGLIPVLQLPLLKKDAYRAQCERAYGDLPTCTSSVYTMSKNETQLKSNLVYYLYITPVLFNIGSTPVDKVMKMYAICQVASYRLQVGVHKQDVIHDATFNMGWKPGDIQKAVDMVFIMEKLCPTWVFQNESVYMKQYLNDRGYV